jgi:integrase
MAGIAEFVKQLNKELKIEGIKGAIEIKNQTLNWRSTCSINYGPRKQQRIPLGLKASIEHVGYTKWRVREIWSKLCKDGTIKRPLSWELPEIQTNQSLSREEAIESLEKDFYRNKPGNNSNINSFKRLLNELKKLPQDNITVDAMIEVIEKQRPQSRAREEACKVFKRVAKLNKLNNYEEIDKYRSKAEIVREKNPFTVEELYDVLNMLRWQKSMRSDAVCWQGWCITAAALYGCRPSETFSIVPKGSGVTAEIVTIKQQRKPYVRSSVSLHKNWVEEFAILDKPKLPYKFNVETWVPDVCKSYTAQLRLWFQKFYPGHDLYDLRHSWAIHSIKELKGNATLSAKMMGHSLHVHTTTYHRWMQAEQVEKIAIELLSR